jgi:monofunctional biosynthetic peptidoglycan transglycosylase
MKIIPRAEDRIASRRKAPQRRRLGLWRRVRRAVLIALLAAMAVPVVLAALYRVVPPPLTPLMVMRLFEGEGIRKQWTPLSRISPHLVKSVIGLEDSRFCIHGGIDWDSVSDAVSEHLHGAPLRGASTISMQTAKNLFLWPEQHFLRKAIEAPLTYMIEAILGKRRIIEIYLNVVEWGPGIYGAEAAAEAYFKRPASALTPWQAGLLASILPSPRKWSPIDPTDYIQNRARTAMARAQILSGQVKCTGIRG